MVASFVVSPLKASAITTSASNEAQIQMLVQLLALLQSMLAELQENLNDNVIGILKADLKAAESDGMAFIPEGGSVALSWNSSGASYCELTRNEQAPIYTNAPKSGYFDYTLRYESANNVVVRLNCSDTTGNIVTDSITIKKLNDGERENLSISSIKISMPGGIDHTNIEDSPMPDQEVVVEVKNNQYGLHNLSGKKFEYKAYLYEVNDSGSRIKTTVVSTGKALVPYANGYISFKFDIAGGLPFEGDPYDMDDILRNFQILIDIDSDDDVDESDETDNRGWSDKWTTEYWEG